MKIKLTNDKASRLINCGEVILASCGYAGKTNIVTCAWQMPISKTPPLLAIALAKGHYSCELITKSREFMINIPQWALLDKVMLCGSVSGRKIDKFKAAEFTPQKANVLKECPKIAECIANIECKLSDTREAGDHFIFFGEVSYAQADDKYFINDFWDTTKVELIFHLGGKFFFKSAPYSEFKPKGQ
jgi:flavin reductase (DIM6/NTAB) family NADH-FMN oxidoreductase RutF